MEHVSGCLRVMLCYCSVCCMALRQRHAAHAVVASCYVWLTAGFLQCQARPEKDPYIQAAEAAASGKRLLLMFDELFKGTNVKDAYDGTLAVTDGFAGYRECLFIISTHIIEVAEALKAHNNIRFVYMPTIMDGAHPRYTYKLQEGITEDRQGMMIIRNEGILELLNK